MKAYGGAQNPEQAITGLAIAQSVVAAVEVFILLLVMVWRDKLVFTVDFWSGVLRTISVSGFTILTTYTLVSLIPLEATDRGFVTLSAKLLAIVIPTFVVHLALSSLFGMEEAGPVNRKLKQIALKPVKIQ